MRRLAVVPFALSVVAGLGSGSAGVLPANPWQARQVLNIAHQGGADEAPSNTLYAFKRALTVGTDHLEMDVHATKDGHLVVIHDATVNRTTGGDGRVDALTLAQIKALDAADNWPDLRGIALGLKPPPEGYEANDFKIPTLEEVLVAFPNALINIEIKNTAPDTAPYEKTLADLLKQYGRADDTIVVSFLDQATEVFKAHALAIGLEVSTATATGETALFWATAQGPAPGAPNPRYQALQVPPVFMGITVVTPEFVQRAHANGLAVHVWDAEGVAVWNQMIDWGVDGIMTDSPLALQAVLCARGVAYDQATDCP
jgi:glycerophosphoryl diester phosphodiesterase